MYRPRAPETKMEVNKLPQTMNTYTKETGD